MASFFDNVQKEMGMSADIIDVAKNKKNISEVKKTNVSKTDNKKPKIVLSEKKETEKKEEIITEQESKDYSLQAEYVPPFVKTYDLLKFDLSQPGVFSSSRRQKKQKGKAQSIYLSMESLEKLEFLAYKYDRNFSEIVNALIMNAD